MLLNRTRRLYEASQVLRETPWIGYAFALGSTALALFARFLLAGVLDGFPFLTFFPAIVLTAFVFGWRAGAVAAIAGGMAAWYFLLVPLNSFRTEGISNVIGIALYVFTVGVMLFLTAGMHRGFSDFAASDRQRRELNEQLEERVRERTAELETANQRLTLEAESRAAAEAQVRQMQKMEAIGQLTGGIAHDFNNMLAIVVGSLDMARRHLTSDHERAGLYLDNVMEGARRAAELTARLLAFSRQQPLDPRAIDANRLVINMSEMLHRSLGGTIRLETVLAGGLWPMFADPPQVESAIINLCVNSRDAMPEGGRITLETMNAHLDDAYAKSHIDVRSGQYVVIAVTDTGTGMSPETLVRAFDPFFTTKAPGKGTGLGLSQVYGFAKQSGGHVKIYSEPGQGTTVRLYLPRYVGPVALTASAQAESTIAAGRAEEVILVVEDEGRVREMSVAALRELGYAVIHAADAAQALTQIDLHPHISLLFTDIVMPDMNGKLLADRVREKRPGIKVLYTTGYTRNAVIHNGMLDRDVCFLPKPFNIAQLAAKVRQALDG